MYCIAGILTSPLWFMFSLGFPMACSNTNFCNCGSLLSKRKINPYSMLPNFFTIAPIAKSLDLTSSWIGFRPEFGLDPPFAAILV